MTKDCSLAMVSSQTSQGHLEQNSETMSEVRDSNQDFRNPPRVLGKPPVGKQRPVQECENASVDSPVKGDLTKVTVSPRVELMLNNELFKKYLSRHGNLLEKLAQRQGRSRGTLKKAFSNLDLSKIDLEEELHSAEDINSSSNVGKEDNKENENDVSVEDVDSVHSLHSQNPAAIRAKRSLSLTGTSDPKFSDLQQALKINEEKANVRNKSRRSKFMIPSFEEFKRSRKEKLKKGQEFVKDVLRNKENIPHSFIKNLDIKCFPTVTSSRRLPKEPVQKGTETTQRNLSTGETTKVNEEQSQVLPKECQIVSRSVETAKVEAENENTEHVFPRQTQERVHRKLPNIENLTLSNIQSSQQGVDVPDSNENSDGNQRTDNNHLTKLVTRKERLKSSESFCVRSPEVSVSSPRRSQSMKSKQRDFCRSNSSKSFTEDVDPLELSTDGNTVYATLNIFSTDVELEAQASDTEEEDDNAKDSQNKCQTENHCGCCLRQKISSPKDNLPLNTESAMNPKTAYPEGYETLNRNSQPNRNDGVPGRRILRATRKRKLPTKQRKHKTEEINLVNTDIPTVRTWPKLCSSLPVDTTTKTRVKRIEKKSPPVHLPLNRSVSCEVFSVNNFSPSSPGTFSFPNSPSDLVSFNFPSTDSSNPGSEIDLYTGEQERTNIQENRSFQPDSKLLISRSTSDVTTDSQRKRRERKQRPYKSDPFSGSIQLADNKLTQNLNALRNNFLSSKEEDCPDDRDDLSLEDVEEERNLFGADPFRSINHRLSNISDVSTDSGVIGPDSIPPPSPPPSPSSSIFSQTSLFGGSEGQTCTDVDEKSFGDSEYNQEKHEKERKETILEIRDTEINYGRDLKILKEEFYKPMKNNGLLTSEQLEDIFQNLEDLIEVNKQFTDRLQQAVEAALGAGDELLTTVVIGDLFLKSTNLIYTFEHYCVNQSQATILLEQLEREKDILRIFLKVCQDEQPILRRMHLKSFLMVPVQRIMKYPLLLERLYRATSPNHHDKEAILSAKNKIEKILEHINSRTRTASQVRLAKRKSADKKYTVTEKIEVTRVAMEVLGWHKHDICDILTSQMQVAPLLNDQNWATKRLRNVKFTSVHAVLLTLGQGELLHAEEESLLFPKRSQVIQAAIVLIKEKNGKFQTFREPFLLNRCIINVDKDLEDVFEVMELNKESCLFKCDDSNLFKLWLQNVKQQTLDLGSWRKRRNALPNIMIKHLV
ncbi:rhoGEF domain-containing protein gxcJ-like isoform X2 [Saccostrea cucullata]|uniref:rhoGEF domain-containing protein gxcJ-like isoform X2 n=1 Tax=Saccostrea cuccullata TaxID=36930 RepID=UPI002ED41D5C